MLTWISGLTTTTWLPNILGHIQNVGLIHALTFKEHTKSLSTWAGKAKKVHYNTIVNLTPFATLIIVAHLASISNNAATITAIAYFWFRFAHYGIYIIALPPLRPHKDIHRGKAGSVILMAGFSIRASFGVFQIPIAQEFGSMRAEFSMAIAIQ